MSRTFGRVVIESSKIDVHPLANELKRQGWEVFPLYNSNKHARIDFWLADMYRDIKRPVEFRLNVAHARRNGVPVLTWNRDAPWNLGAKPWRLWLIKKLHYLDIYLSHSLQGAAGFAGESHYFPNAADTNRYHLNGATLADMRQPKWYDVDVAFVGNIDARAHPEMHQRVSVLRQFAAKLQVLGISTRFVDSRGMPISEQIRIIQHSRINLNVGAACDDGPEPSWGLPERCYGVQACGGLLLSDLRPHSDNDFLRGTEWQDFRTIDQGVERIQWLLSDLQRARDIADAAYYRVMQQHTYQHRTGQLLEWVAEWRNRHPWIHA